MTILNTLVASVLSLVFLQANAQTEIPKGFQKGTITLADNSNLPGFVKDNIRKDASIVFIQQAGEKKKTYNGSELVAAEIDDAKFLCISGDFFKVLCQGNLCFLQKSSDASGKPTYNGNEATFSSGTEGKLNDYFIYNGKDKQLKLVSKKNADEVIAASFAGNTAAIEKARSANGDIAQLKEAVQVYNNGTNK
ncbi:MAG TPA: hypothetical protein VIZ28_12955 [Chitinophagaceae bacterium]